MQKGQVPKRSRRSPLQHPIPHPRDRVPRDSNLPMIGAPAVKTDGKHAGHAVRLDILHENAPRRCRKRQWPTALSFGWMLNWARTRHQRRVAKERIKKEARVGNKEKGRVMQLPQEVVAEERSEDGVRGAMNVVGPTFTAVSKSPTVRQGRGPKSQDR